MAKINLTLQDVITIASLVQQKMCEMESPRSYYDLCGDRRTQEERNAEIQMLINQNMNTDYYKSLVSVRNCLSAIPFEFEYIENE